MTTITSTLKRHTHNEEIKHQQRATMTIRWPRLSASPTDRNRAAHLFTSLHLHYYSQIPNKPDIKWHAFRMGMNYPCHCQSLNHRSQGALTNAHMMMTWIVQKHHVTLSDVNHHTPGLRHLYMDSLQSASNNQASKYVLKHPPRAVWLNVLIQY